MTTVGGFISTGSHHYAVVRGFIQNDIEVTHGLRGEQPHDVRVASTRSPQFGIAHPLEDIAGHPQPPGAAAHANLSLSRGVRQPSPSDTSQIG